MAFVYIYCSGVRTYSSRNVLYLPLVLVPLAWPRLSHIILALLAYTSSYPIPSLSPFVVCPEVDPSRDSPIFGDKNTRQVFSFINISSKIHGFYAKIERK